HAGIIAGASLDPHAGTIPGWKLKAEDAVVLEHVQSLARSIGATRVMAGNWHDGKTWDRPPVVCQVGALAPTGCDNPGLGRYAQVVVADVKEGWTRRFPVHAGPRFLTKMIAGLSSFGGAPVGVVEQVEEALRGGFRPYVRVDAEDALEFESARA